MNPKLQLRIQRYGWDIASSFYENSWQAQLKPAQDLLLKLADIREGERVLDTACGTGLVTFRIAEITGETGSVLGSDISAEMVQRASEIADAQKRTNVSFERTEAEKLNCEDGAFDLLTCALGLMYVSDTATSFSEMFRVLRPGGRAVVAVWGARKHCGWADIFPIVDSRVKSEVCPMFFNLGTGDSLVWEFENAGFHSVTLERITSPLEYQSAEEAVEAAFLGGPVALAYDRFDSDTKEEAAKEYLKSIEPYRKGSRYTVPGEFVVARALKPG